jgi:hypothetical protein
MLNGRWTFSDLYIEWVHDTFQTKEDAINVAKEFYTEGCYIGQLEAYVDKYYLQKYRVINQEKLAFN